MSRFYFMGVQEDPEFDTIEARGNTRIYDGTALDNQVVDPVVKRYLCRCFGISRTAAEVRAMSEPTELYNEEDPETGRLALHSCPACHCTHSLPWRGK